MAGAEKSVAENPALADHGVVRPRPWLAAGSLAAREWVRFVRQRNRIVGALGQPILFWLLFGAGLGPSFRWSGAAGESVTYREYFFPGTIVLILLFTAIFTTISIIEDRREGFLQSVLVAPIPRWSMVLGKLLGGTAIASVQGILFLLLAPWLGFQVTPVSAAGLVAMVLLISFALTALGFVIAWRMESTQGFHAIMNLLLMPMWLLSGAFFPASEGWLGWVVRLNPLTYGVAGMRRMLYWDKAASLDAALPSLPLCWGVLLLFTIVVFGLAGKISAQRTTGDLL